jgi:hypothetical protein
MYGIYSSGLITHVGPPKRSAGLAQTAYADDDLLGRALDEFSRQLAKAGGGRGKVTSPILTTIGAGKSQDFVGDGAASDPNLFAYDRSVRLSLVLSQLRSEITLEKPSDNNGLRTMVAKVAGKEVWNITAPEPGAGAAFFSEDLAEVVKVSNEVNKASRRRSNQLAELVVQHHEAPIFMLAAVGATSETHPYTVECLDAAAAMIDALVHPIKHAFSAPRPARRSPRVVPLLQAPTHFSFPSGHATYAYCAAEILASICDQFSDKTDLRDALQRAADLIADNRVVAGVHYPCDSDAGRAVGYALGRWLVGQGSMNGSGELAKAAYVASTQSNKWKATLTYGIEDSSFTFQPTVRWRALMYRAAQEWKA